MKDNNPDPAIPVAVVRDGKRTVLVIIGSDRSRLPEDVDTAAFEARRQGDALILVSTNVPELSLAADVQAELDMRMGKRLTLSHAGPSGLTEIAREIRISWPSVLTARAD